jgi:hypothetical protein
MRDDSCPVIAIHAIWSRESQLCVWGEDSALPARAPVRRGRPPATPRPRAHPFACGADGLSGALRRLCPKLDPGPFVERDLSLLLPSSKDGPQASPHLLRDEEDAAPAGRFDVLQLWVVPVASLATADALEVLLGLPRARSSSASFAASARKRAGACSRRSLGGKISGSHAGSRSRAIPAIPSACAD